MTYKSQPPPPKAKTSAGQQEVLSRTDKQKENSTYSLNTASDIKSLPDLTWLIDKVMPIEGLSCIYGASGSGKSFLALDAACCVAEGKEWFSKKTTRTPVIIVSLEGSLGLKNRIKAWEKNNERAFPVGIKFIVREEFTLIEPSDKSGRTDVSKDVIKLIQTIEMHKGYKPWVIIDTLNRAMNSYNENDGQVMSAAISALEKIAFRGLQVSVIHHSGKDETRGLRGHSSLRAALDSSIEIVKDSNDRLFWKIDKAKDAEGGLAAEFRLKAVGVGSDEASCTIEAITPLGSSAINPKRPKVPTSGTPALIFQIISDIAKGSAVKDTDGVPLVPIEEVAKVWRSTKSGKTGSQFYANRLINSLAQKGAIKICADKGTEYIKCLI